MSTLPLYAWVIVLLGLMGTVAAICAGLWRGALNAGVGRRTATRVAVGVGIVWGSWGLVSAALADADVYRFQQTRAVPWIGVAVVAPLAVALAFSRTPFARRVLSEPDSLWRLTVPQFFRPVGAAFLVAMALGQLPAVFALPAGLGDIAIGVEAVFVARNLRRGIVDRRVVWFNILGLTDLMAAGAIGFTAAPGLARLLDVSPSTEAISLLPLALILTAIVPLATALHLLSLQKLAAAKATTRALVGSAR
jgi:multisubunit Na+/H+ antiporter MnhC subunit